MKKNSFVQEIESNLKKQREKELEEEKMYMKKRQIITDWNKKKIILENENKVKEEENRNPNENKKKRRKRRKKEKRRR